MICSTQATDEWVRTEGELIVVGITHYAQDQLGELVHLELPEVDATVEAEAPVGEVESVKAVAEIYAPTSGAIVEVNTALADNPEAINSDPYGSWIYKMRPSGAVDGLLSPEQYTERTS